MEQSVKPGVIGRGIPRSHARRLAAGRGAYADDLRFPRLLHAAFLRSPHARARIVRLDLSHASDKKHRAQEHAPRVTRRVDEQWFCHLVTRRLVSRLSNSHGAG